MSKKNKESDDMLPEYDFASMKGVRGKYFARYRAGTNVVLLEPDVARVFRSGSDVNKALRALLEISHLRSAHAH